MNYENMEKEISEYKSLSQQEEQTLTKLSQLFKTISKHGVQFISKIKSSLEELNQELSKENRTSTHNISLTKLFLDFKSFLENIKQLFSLIDINIVEKIDEFIQENKSNSEENSNKLYSILVKLSESKAKMEKYKYSYFEASKTMIEKEKKNLEKKKSGNGVDKYGNISEGQKQIYREELNKFNNMLDEEEEEYQKIINKYTEGYKNKINCLITSIITFKSYGKILEDKLKEMLTNIERSIPIINVKNDIKYYKIDMNYLNENKRRFLKEEFLDYEILKKGIEAKEKEEEEEDETRLYVEHNLSSMKNIVAKYNISYEKSLRIINLGKIDEEIEIEDTEENKKINKYITELLTKEKELDREKYVFLLSYLSGKDENIIKFIDILMSHYTGNQFIKMKNLENIKLFSNILNIIINCSFNNKNIFYICFIAMFISEKTIFFSKKNPSIKYYLCKLLPKKSTTTIFSSNNFWIELINANIAMLADILTKREIDRREKLKETNKNSSMLNKVKNMFNKKDLENQKIENEILYNQIYTEKLPNYCVKILNDYLRHFSNFDFDPKKASEIIVDMSIKYKFQQSYVTFFIAQLNSNMCVNLNKNNIKEEEYIKEINEDNNTEESSISSIIEEDTEIKIDYELLYKKKLDKKIFKHITDPKLRILIYSIKFLELEELPNLLAINKTYNKTLVKYIYKNLLIKFGKELDISKHILIWKILLNYTQTTIKYNYEDIKQKISVNPNQEQFRIIDLDVKRTNFISNNALNQIKIGNILKSIHFTYNKLNYCQGMNYIAAFFLNITNNEEESFFLFLSMILYTDYGKLFEKDLEKLKKYFYVFERVVCINLPELYVHFKETNIDVSFFLSPWLITLFTDNYKTIKDRNNPLILLKIFDLFFFSGWKSIIKIGITLLKNYESKLMSLGQDDLLKYLISGICKNNFFQNEYYDNLVHTLENYKLEGYLVSSIENEYELKKSLPLINGKNIFEMSNI